ncbi:hypothetical protein ACWZEH_33630 [Streptomyces sp. QTS137]
MAVQLRLLRRCGRTARALTLTLTFAGGTGREKGSRPAGPSAQDADPRTLSPTRRRMPPVSGVPDRDCT